MCVTASTPPSLPDIPAIKDSIAPLVSEATVRQVLVVCNAVSRTVKKFYLLGQQKVSEIMNPEKDENNAANGAVVVPEIAVDTNRKVEKADEN